MSDLRLVSREFLTDFINIYKESPCLWKVKSQNYSDKQKRNAAYKVLIEKLKQVDPAANKDAVIKKVNSLRTCFRRELKKHNMSSHSDMDKGEIRKPSLWYFDLLLFLTDQEAPRQDSIDNFIKKDVDDESIVSENTDTLPSELLSRSETSTPSPSSAMSNRRSIKRKPDKLDRGDDVLDTVADRLQNQGKYIAYGKCVAEELQDLTPKMAIYCKRMINEAIFQAQLGNLTENSKIITGTH